MYLFTYKDYLKYSREKEWRLEEESAKYTYDVEQEKIHQYKDKIFKEILSNKKEFIRFIQKYLKSNKFESLTESDVEKYNKEFITSKFEKRESDNIYKIPKFNMYVIIEHQSQIDYKMSERITEYSVELMRDINKNNKSQIGNSAIIVPIVLYTGNRKWNKFEEDKQLYKFEFKVFEYTKFNLIDINDYTKEELIKEDTGMSKALLFEKTNSKEELKEAMNEILQKELTKEEKEYIVMILKYSNKVIKFIPKERKNYIEKLEERGNEEMKFGIYFSEWLEDEKREGEKIGEKRGEKLGMAKAIKQMVKEMIKNNINDEQIMRITKIDKKELEKLKIA